jgi:hypothetical protein
MKKTLTGFGQQRDRATEMNRSEEDGMNHFARKPEETLEAWVERLEETDPSGLSEADQLLHRECLAAARRQLEEQQRWQRTLIEEGSQFRRRPPELTGSRPHFNILSCCFLMVSSTRE